jgi:hypothetical protein
MVTVADNGHDERLWRGEKIADVPECQCGGDCDVALAGNNCFTGVGVEQPCE